MPSNFTPNAEQAEIISNLYQQLVITSHTQDADELFLLEGQAGTGKTSTIMHLFSYPEFQQMKICFSCPTNKALNVMMERVSKQDDDPDHEHEKSVPIGGHGCQSEHSNPDGQEEEGQNRSFLTVFKLTESRTSIGADGRTSFQLNEESTRLPYDIVVIDEVSMMEEKQVETILKIVSRMKTNMLNGLIGCHVPSIIFLGDSGQLPPVSETSSPIFNPAFQHRHHIQKMKLSCIMRSRNHNQLTDLFCDFRQLILPTDASVSWSEQDVPWVDLKKHQSQGPDVRHFNQQEPWLDRYVEMFQTNSNSKVSTSAPIILVYTNAEGDSLNQICRQRIFNGPTEQYVPGELVIFKTFYNVNRMKSLTPNARSKSPYYIKFFTSEQLLVTRVQSTRYTIAPLNLQSLVSSVKIVDKLSPWVSRKVSQHASQSMTSEIQELLSDAVVDSLTGLIKSTQPLLDAHLNRIYATIKRLSRAYHVNELYFNDPDKIDPHDTDPATAHLTVIAADSLDDYTSHCETIRTLLIREYRSLTHSVSTRPAYLLLVEYLFQLIWRQYYYRSYVWPFAQITYGYAITIYKSQGSTYENIFVDIPNILGCKKVEESVKSRSLYTAISRAAHTINIYHHKVILTPTPTSSLVCQECHQSSLASQFSSINWTIDRPCANRILSKIRPMEIYETSSPSASLIVSDKYQNLYLIPLADYHGEHHINDVYQYLIEHHLLRPESLRYQYSNVMLAKQVSHMCKTN